MRIDSLKSYDSNFEGRVIYPEKLTPKLERFKELANEQISKLIADKPLDIYVKEIKQGKNTDISVSCNATDKDFKLNWVMRYLLYERISEAKNRMMIEEVREFMARPEMTKIIDVYVKPIEKFDQTFHIPRKIGNNKDIFTKSKQYGNYRNHTMKK